jgi:hypothetical protein
MSSGACRFTSFVLSQLYATPAALLTRGYSSLQVSDFEAVIVPQEQASDFIYSLNGERITNSWTPTEEDILEMEDNIKAYIEELPPNTLMPLKEYKRQYAGAIINDHRLLYGNFFCQAFEVDWRKDPLVVMDGGNCFFQVIYDLYTQDFVSFNINGEG